MKGRINEREKGFISIKRGFATAANLALLVF